MLQMNINPIIIILILIGVSFIIFPIMQLEKSRDYYNIIFLLIIIFVFFTWSLITTLWSPLPALSFQRAIITFVPLLLVVILVWSDPYPMLTFRRVAKTIVILVSVVSAIGLLIYFFGSYGFDEQGRIQSFKIGFFTLQQRLFGAPPFLRLTSLTDNPNTLAALILIASLLTIYLMRLNDFKPYTGLGILLVLLLTLMLTFSRAGIGATVVAAATYLVLIKKDFASKIKYTYLLLVCTVVSIFFMYWLFNNISSERFSLDMNYRNILWGTILSISEDSYFGVGFGVANEAVLEKFNLAPHNVYLQVLVECGIPGLLIFMSMWILSLFLIFSFYMKSSWYKANLFSIIIALQISFMLHQFFEGSLLRFGIVSFFWVYILAVGLHPMKYEPQ
jgi:O-antigen ligase